MNTNEGELIHVEAYSLQDFANGKSPFKHFKKPVDRTGGALYGQLISMAVLEGGTEKGEASCVFLVLHEGKNADGSDDKFFLFETTAQGLKNLAASLKACQEYFDKHPKEGEAQ